MHYDKRNALIPSSILFAAISWWAVFLVQGGDAQRPPDTIQTAAQDDDSLLLWNNQAPLLPAGNTTRLKDVVFSVIKAREPEADGYSWLHGIALAWHNNQLFATFGHNRGRENTASEEARGRISLDDGRTWGPLFTIDSGEEPGLAVSHGVLLSHKGRLWAFQGAFYGKRERVHTRAYVLNKESHRWEQRGAVVEGGFWPMQQPIRMADGNWLMAGFVVGQGNPPAVAISDGEDLLKWKLVKIATRPTGRVWGESTVIVDGPRLINIARYGHSAVALVARSFDYGHSWTLARPSNLPMVASKPYAGVLSTRQKYLIATTTADSGNRRSPLTIAVSPDVDEPFSKVFVIRDATHTAGAGESHERAALSYPYAVERAGKLYVAYSNDGGRGANQNSAELAVFPVSALDPN